jgi:hypothetical protein
MKEETVKNSPILCHSIGNVIRRIDQSISHYICNLWGGSVEGVQLGAASRGRNTLILPSSYNRIPYCPYCIIFQISYFFYIRNQMLPPTRNGRGSAVFCVRSLQALWTTNHFPPQIMRNVSRYFAIASDIDAGAFTYVILRNTWLKFMLEGRSKKSSMVLLTKSPMETMKRITYTKRSISFTDVHLSDNICSRNSPNTLFIFNSGWD